MTRKSLVLVAGLGALAILEAAAPAAAQSSARTPLGQAQESFSLPRRHTRIEIHPRPLRFRRCVDWYVLQNRPSGTVLFPEYHCWWVRG